MIFLEFFDEFRSLLGHIVGYFIQHSLLLLFLKKHEIIDYLTQTVHKVLTGKMLLDRETERKITLVEKLSGIMFVKTERLARKRSQNVRSTQILSYIVRKISS